MAFESFANRSELLLPIFDLNKLNLGNEFHSLILPSVVNDDF